jgi:RecA-family ATPase
MANLKQSTATELIKLRSYTGDTLRSNSTAPQPIIENFLWREDAVMLLGSEKAGKSINAQQMLVDIVTGNPYLGKYQIKTSGSVVYIQAEGKRDEFVNRLNNMCMGIDGSMDDSRFLHIFRKYCPLNVEIFKQAVFETIDAFVLKTGSAPIVICVDSVYKAMEGDINSNQDIIAFTNTIDEFIARYHCAVLLIHHDSKEWRDDKMNAIDRGDKGSYGSVFLRAYVDHIIYLKMNRDKTRSLICDTTRSNQTVQDSLELVLVEPQPLLFQIKGDYKASIEIILHNIKIHKALSYKEIEEKTGLAYQTLKQGMAVLLKDKKVVFNGEKEKVFSLK